MVPANQMNVAAVKNYQMAWREDTLDEMNRIDDDGGGASRLLPREAACYMNIVVDYEPYHDDYY